MNLVLLVEFGEKVNAKKIGLTPSRLKEDQKAVRKKIWGTLRKLVRPPLQNTDNDWVKGMRYGDAR
jgi:hypothetical protein